ncbi:unnamed protein product, partial [Nippostrongylus brasiliensis]|uniref:CCHC-type domain-containing protein n=1 Tax=Nippostrongylus brasiliensis TaxID=27835 RepID=A0A0N4YZE7_NIPBR
MEAPGVDSYARLKEAALRIERRKLTLESTKGAYQREKGRGMRQNPSSPCKPLERGDRSGPPRELREGNDKERRSRCYKCQGIGHIARNCKSGSSNHVGSKVTGLVGEISLGAEDSTVVRAEQTPAFGKKFMTKVEIFRKTWDALLDTGSEISIMPVAVYNEVKREEGWCEVPLDKTKRICDASGNRMRFLTVIEVPIKENGNRRIKVKMHVSKQQGNTLILGTNALPALNYSLLRQSKRRERQDAERKVRVQLHQERGETSVSGSEGPKMDKPKAREDKVVVSKRSYVAPGECKWVEIRGGGEPGEKILESTSDWIHSGLCAVDDSGATTVPVWNVATEPLVLKLGQEVGQEVGTWKHDDAQFAKVTAKQIATDMLVFGEKGLDPNERRKMLD